MVVAVGDLDDQPPVGATQAQPHRRDAVLEGVGDEFAGREHAEVVQLGGESPRGEDAGGERAGARGGFGAAEEFEGGAAEEVGVAAGALGALQDEDGDVVVVFAGDAHGAQQAVADDVGAAGRSGDGAFEGGDALVDVGVAAFDEAVGVEDGGAAVAERHGAGGVQPAAGAQRRAGGVGGAVDGAVGVADEDGQVAGGGVAEPALVRVVHRVDAGGDLAGVDLGRQAVEQLQHLVRREVEAGVGADGGAQLAHDGGGAHAAAHDVADDEGGAAGAERDDVVPVAADGRVGDTRLVGRGDAQVVGLFEFLRQQAALQGDGGLALAAFAGAEPLGGLGLVGDVGGEEEHAGLLAGGQRRAGEGVVARPGGAFHAPGLDGARPAAAQDLVHQREQAELGEFREGAVGGGAERAAAEDVGVGVVDVGEPVVGPCRTAASTGTWPSSPSTVNASTMRAASVTGPCVACCRRGCAPRAAGTVLAASAGTPFGEALTAGSARPADGLPFFLAFVAACVAAVRRCVPGRRALQRVKFTSSDSSTRLSGSCAFVRVLPAGRRSRDRRRWSLLSLFAAATPTHGHMSSVAHGADIRQTPPPDRGFRSASGVVGQLASGCRPVCAASSNSARGFSSEPSETISRLKSPASTHSASTRAFRLKVGTRLRWYARCMNQAG